MDAHRPIPPSGMKGDMDLVRDNYHYRAPAPSQTPNRRTCPLQETHKNNNTAPGWHPISGTSHSPRELAAEWLESVRGTLSPHTLRALSSDLGKYRSWCARQRLKPWPVRATALARFIDWMAGDKAPATVERHVYSILSLCRGMDWKDPGRTGAVRAALDRMRRMKGRRQDQAVGLTRVLLDQLIAASGDRLIDVRNRALLAVAYDALLRRSELVSLQVADLTMEPDGSATLLVRRGKTDPEGEGTVLYLAPDTVSLVLEWLEGSGIRDGCLFRAVSRSGRPGRGLDPGQVPRIYKSMARKAGLGEDVVASLSGHSTRVGAVQDMLALHVGLPAIMQAGRWKSTAMVCRYGERVLPRRSGSAQLARMQERAPTPDDMPSCACFDESNISRRKLKAPPRAQLSCTKNRRNPAFIREVRPSGNWKNPGFVESHSPADPNGAGIGGAYPPLTHGYGRIYSWELYTIVPKISVSPASTP